MLSRASQYRTSGPPRTAIDPAAGLHSLSGPSCFESCPSTQTSLVVWPLTVGSANGPRSSHEPRFGAPGDAPWAVPVSAATTPTITTPATNCRSPPIPDNVRRHPAGFLPTGNFGVGSGRERGVDGADDGVDRGLERRGHGERDAVPLV